MSYEAWGTPPDPEPRYCPLCDQQSHDHDCELGKMQARAFIAEQQRDELLAALGKFIAWNKAYPSSRIYSASAIRVIAKELDQIAEQAEAAIASVKGGAA